MAYHVRCTTCDLDTEVDELGIVWEFIDSHENEHEGSHFIEFEMIPAAR